MNPRRLWVCILAVMEGGEELSCIGMLFIIQCFANSRVVLLMCMAFPRRVCARERYCLKEMVIVVNILVVGGF